MLISKTIKQKQKHQNQQLLHGTIQNNVSLNTLAPWGSQIDTKLAVSLLSLGLAGCYTVEPWEDEHCFISHSEIRIRFSVHACGLHKIKPQSAFKTVSHLIPAVRLWGRHAHLHFHVKKQRCRGTDPWRWASEVAGLSQLRLLRVCLCTCTGQFSVPLQKAWDKLA